MKKRRYLAYGSNLHPVRLKERVPSAVLLGKVILEGWKLCFHKRGFLDGTGKCNLVEAGTDHTAHGAVYEMDSSHVADLDRFEGDGYARRELTLRGFGQVFVYLGEADYVDNQLRPYFWYRDLVRHGAEYHQFPGQYVESIRSIDVHEDSDSDRVRRHLALIERLRT